MNRRDWATWHAAYDDPASNLSRRLATVQQRIREALDNAADGPIRTVSICAGDGRDLFGALVEHPRRCDVRARLVERDHRLVARGREAVASTEIDIVEGDAALTDLYAGAVPANLVLLCGVFGNIPDADVARTIGALPEFTAADGLVIWTRHRREPDLVPTINTWFAEQNFEPVWLSPKDAGYGVGVHRFTGATRPLRTGARLFTFIQGTSIPVVNEQTTARPSDADRSARHQEERRNTSQ